MYQNLMQGKAFNPFGCNDVPEYRSDHLDASKVKTLWSPTREASIAHNTLSWLGALPPLQKAFMPSVGQSASERLSSSPPSMFGAQTWAANFRKFHLTCSWRTAFLHRQAFQLQTTLLYLGLIKTKWSCDLMQAMGMRFITERRFNSLPCQSYPASAFNNGYMGERLKLKAER